MSFMNRLGNVNNKFQGEYKRVLCVCSAGLLRSPTAAFVLSQEPYNFNTRAVGIEEEFALIPIDSVMIEWADEIVCMQDSHRIALIEKFPDVRKPIKVLAIPDRFSYRDPELMRLIREKYDLLS